MADAAPSNIPHAAAVARMLARMAAAPAPWLHGEVARRMAERLPVIRSTPSTVVEWWGHLGASGEALTATYPKARRVVVEPTPALLATSRGDRAAPWWRRLRAAPAEVVAEGDVVAGGAQLLWANMMLHWVDAAKVIAQWRRALEVDGFLMFSTYGPDTLVELRALYGDLGWPVPATACTDMHDIGDLLVHAGFADPVMDQEHLTLTWPDADALLDELHTLGANTDPQRHPGLRTPRWRERLRTGLQRLADGDGRLRLSFEIVYGHAFNPAPRAPVSRQTQVSLDAMRAMVRAGRKPR